MLRICAECKKQLGCWDNNGDSHDCETCLHKNCPSPNAEVTSPICNDCIEERRQTRYQDKVFDGIGHS